MPERRVVSFWNSLHPVQKVALGYLSYVVLGWILLSLPFCQQAERVHALDCLFISTSAMSTTGLVTVSVSDRFNLLGEAVVLALIQLGGLGYMTLSSFVILSRRRDLSDERSRVGEAVFTLPRSFRIDKFLRSVIVFTVTIEVLGALALYPMLRGAGVAQPLWSAVFHSVSAFCTAGFGLYNNSFEDFAGHFWLNLVVAALSYLGAIGFIVCVDGWRRLTGKVEHMTLTSKIILHFTFWTACLGTTLIFLGEPSVQSLAPDKRLLASFFQAMTAMTTVGFNTISISTVSKGTLLILMVLMVIGASPSGTGGGLKTTTFSAFMGVMRSTLRGRVEVCFWGHAVPAERVRAAVAAVGFYLSTLVVGIYLLDLCEGQPFEALMFEAASALGTVGLSTGVTPELTNLGKLIVVALMFVGRLGPLSFSLALFVPRGLATQRDSDLAV